MKTYKTDTVDLRCMDCVEMMRSMPDNSVDSIVCDPPYGLSKEPDVAEVLRHWLAGDDYVHKGSGFMGKSWDSFVPGPTIWKEAYRVLKPGGHLLAFAGSRTQDLMGMAIRLAGFENRDCIMWVFGSGFPKSANVSKMIDKQAGAEREVVGYKKLNERDKKVYTPNVKTSFVSDSAGENDAGLTGQEITAPATEAAKQWDGFGTALKPAYEPCLMFRKPLGKGNTVAANVLEHGTGAINVDGCRVGTETIKTNAKPKGSSFTSIGSGQGFNGVEESTHQGRWPANFCHDGSDEVVGLFPVTTSGGGVKLTGKGASNNIKFQNNTIKGNDWGSNSGSAARFFYCAKSSKRDRDEGCEGLEERGNNRYGDFAGTADHAPKTQDHNKSRNHHPTVKPTDLMRYLVRLVTPPNGTCLDPFMGSGSTGKAAMLEGFNFIGCDLDEEYFEIAKARILAAQKTRTDATAQEVLDL